MVLSFLTAAFVWRDNKVKGDIHSGAHEPDKADIRRWGQSVESLVGVGVARRTAALLATVVPATGTFPLAAVTHDPDPEKNGFWTWTGSAWQWDRPFPDTIAVLTNLGGSANAVTASTKAGVSPAQVVAYFVQPAVNNTGAMTLSINGGDAKPVLDVNGDPMAAGLWTAGRLIQFVDNGDEYRLVSDPDADGAAASAATSSQEARDALENLKERYLGQYADNTAASAAAALIGGAIEGMLYWNSTSNVFRYWDGDSWETIPYASPAPASVTIEMLDSEVAAKVNAGGGADALLLTLTSGVALSQADVTGATYVYALPAGSGSIGIYDGTTFTQRPVTAQITLTLTTDAHLADKNYDVFAAYSGGNVVVGTGPSWQDGGSGGSNTARGTGAGSTEIELYQGRIVNKNAITLTNGATTYSIAARQAVLVGGFRTVAAGQTEDSALKRFLSQAILPQLKTLKRAFEDSSYEYSTATLRQSGGNANNKVSVFQCLGGRMVDATMQAFVFNSTSTDRAIGIGIGLNSTDTDGGTLRVQGYCTNTRAAAPLAILRAGCVLGLNEVVALERGNGNDAQNWFSTSASGNSQAGLGGSVIV